MMTKRAFTILLLMLAASLVAVGCGGSGGSDSRGDTSSTSTTKPADDDASATEDAKLDNKVAQRADAYDAPPTEKLDPKKTYAVELDTDKGLITIKVDPKAGPIASANFVFLVREGFYDGVKFHRVMKDFMIQTGDPTGTGTGGPGYRIKDDEVSGGYERGTVAMANAGPDTGGSQFFIVDGTDVQLPPDYAIFGHVTDPVSLKTLDAIAGVKVEPGANGEPSSPTETVRIRTAKLIVS